MRSINENTIQFSGLVASLANCTLSELHNHSVSLLNQQKIHVMSSSPRKTLLTFSHVFDKNKLPLTCVYLDMSEIRGIKGRVVSLLPETELRALLSPLIAFFARGNKL